MVWLYTQTPITHVTLCLVCVCFLFSLTAASWPKEMIILFLNTISLFHISSLLSCFHDTINTSEQSHWCQRPHSHATGPSTILFQDNMLQPALIFKPIWIPKVQTLRYKLVNSVTEYLMDTQSRICGVQCPCTWPNSSPIQFTPSLATNRSKIQTSFFHHQRAGCFVVIIVKYFHDQMRWDHNERERCRW